MPPAPRDWHGFPGAGSLRGEAEATHPLPTALLADRPPEVGAHPGRHTAAGPEPTVWCCSDQRLPQLFLLPRIEQRCGARVGVAPVADGGGARPVATRDLLHPAHRVAGHRCHLRCGRAAGQQPQHLPLATRHRILRFPVALMPFRDAQMRDERHPSCHGGSLHPDFVFQG
jgi:hypothetical protein